MFRTILDFIDSFNDLLFPVRCLGCSQSLGTNEKVLCTTCRINLPETGYHRQANQQVLLAKFAGKVPVRFAASYVHFNKGGLVQKLIHHIKYKGQKEAAKEVATWYGHQLKAESSLMQDVDLLVSVPLHKSRQQQRGYNQAEWIAEGLSLSLNIPTQSSVLIQNQVKQSQTRKNRIERWQNVETIFAVSDPTLIKGKNIVVVDDVLTTGATVEACAVELLKAGCQSVGVLTIAATHR